MGTIAQKGTYHGIRYADLQSKGVRCWFASEDMKIGDCLRPRIDETIRLYDKLLLVLSKTSVASQWVEQEVETALARYPYWRESWLERVSAQVASAGTAPQAR